MCSWPATRGHACWYVQGWEPRVLWISIGGCIFFSALEQAKKAYAPKKPVHPL